MKRTLFVLLFLAVGASSAAAQAFDSPSFMSPRQGDDIGVYFADPDLGDWQLQAIWRNTGNLNLGLRGGVLKGFPGDDDTQVMLGVEFWDAVMHGSRDLPLIDINWTAGAGVSFGSDATEITVPVGLTIGANLDAGTLVLIPYFHPRVALDFTHSTGDSEVDLALPIDLGADVRLSNGVIIRVGGTLTGDGHEAVGVGLAFPFARGVRAR